MNHARITADFKTYAKVICVAVVAAGIFFPILARHAGWTASNALVVKAGKPSTFAERWDSVIR
ncbi:MAG TPA: hypothetical protein VN989_02025 [Casimicrobiaceae bacterium]|nr:hypothetical protein [Casimicrobiaceae bacterium]